MPSRQVHNAIAKLLFPWIPYSKIDEINKTIDSAYFLNPKKHRQIFGHRKESGLALTILEKDPNAMLLWALHVGLDKFKFKKRNYKG